MRYPRHCRWLPSLLAVLILAGCGFQLRGQAHLPPQLRVVYLRTPTQQGVPPSGMVTYLRQLLRANGVKVLDSPEGASATLDILREDSRQRQIAANREGDRQSAFTYQVDFQVLLPDGKVLLPRTTVSANRDVIYNEKNNLLGAAENEQLTLRTLQTDVARALLRRLEAVQGSS